MQNLSIFSAKIVNVHYGFKYLQIVFTNDLVNFKTVIAKTGGMGYYRLT